MLHTYSMCRLLLKQEPTKKWQQYCKAQAISIWCVLRSVLSVRGYFCCCCCRLLYCTVSCVLASWQMFSSDSSVGMSLNGFLPNTCLQCEGVKALCCRKCQQKCSQSLSWSLKRTEKAKPAVIMSLVLLSSLFETKLLFCERFCMYLQPCHAFAFF